MIVRMMLGLLPFLINAVDSSPDDHDDNDHDDHSDDDNKPTFTEAQQTAINRIVAREARKAAEKARAERDAELEAEREAAEAELREKYRAGGTTIDLCDLVGKLAAKGLLVEED